MKILEKISKYSMYVFIVIDILLVIDLFSLGGGNFTPLETLGIYHLTPYKIVWSEVLMLGKYITVSALLSLFFFIEFSVLSTNMEAFFKKMLFPHNIILLVSIESLIYIWGVRQQNEGFGGLIVFVYMILLLVAYLILCGVTLGLYKGLVSKRKSAEI